MNARRALLVITLFMLLIVVGMRMAGRVVSSPVDTPTESDVIVSLGGDPGRRVRKVQKLYAEGFAPRILLIGVNGGTAAGRPASSGWQAIFFAESGVPPEAILHDSRSTNSWEEAVNTRALVEREGWRRVLVVSDPPHLRRLSWVWSRVFAGSGCEVRLVPSHMQGWDADRWWQDEYSRRFVLKELVKLGYYAFRY